MTKSKSIIFVTQGLLSRSESLKFPGLFALIVGDASKRGPLEGGGDDAGLSQNILRIAVARGLTRSVVIKLTSQRIHDLNINS